ncbi:hypothetical protein M422DRAFT_23318 [Sphaerobolus stellatus SS14]|nr:hypothetical protein M422DRAFT_23318 [Sphaerobolus stellatus SS14]
METFLKSSLVPLDGSSWSDHFNAREIEDNVLKYNLKYDKSKAVRTAFGGTVPEGSVGLPANEQWKLHRRMMAPRMTPSYLSSKMNTILENLHQLLAIWSIRSKLAQDSSGIFECGDDIERFALDTMTDALFRENLKALRHLIN